MPNAFTPNGDGLNDVFEAKTNLSDVGFTFHMSIYNKWGEEIFTSNDFRKGWDGTFKGQLCQEDLYTWTIRFSAPPKYSFVQKSPQRGFVMLLR
jgi:gliding motility-associated-like protein